MRHEGSVLELLEKKRVRTSKIPRKITRRSGHFQALPLGMRFVATLLTLGFYAKLAHRLQ